MEISTSIGRAQSWIFKKECNAEYEITHYKARLVVRGFRQKERIDYNETFSSFAELDTVRSIISIAAREQLEISQFDIGTVFLYGSINEEIYMKLLGRFED